VSLRPDEQNGGEDIVAEINVTPLTDIFLVLLIIFMVTSTALVQQSTGVHLPHAAADETVPHGTIITATADRRIAVDGVPVTMEKLEKALRQAFRGNPVRRVVLQGDRRMILDRVVRIMTAAKAAGAEKISIATEAPQPKESE